MEIVQQGGSDENVEPAETKTSPEDNSVESSKPSQNNGGGVLNVDGGDGVAPPSSSLSTTSPTKQDIADATAGLHVR